MAWPATVTLPSNVNPGDRITASYTNVQAQAFRDLWTNIQASQTPWQQDINGGGHTLSNVGYLNMRAAAGYRVEAVPGIITIVPQAGVGPFNVFNAAATAADWAIDPNGHFTSATGRNIGTGGGVSTAFMVVNGYGGTNSLMVHDSAPALAWVVDPSGQLVSYGKRGIHNIGVAIITPVSGANAFIVYNAAMSAADWVIDSAGTLFSGTGRGVSNVGSVTFADSSVQTTAYKGVAANQSPWLQDIDAARHTLWNTKAVEIIPVDTTTLRLSIYNTAAQVDWAVTGDGTLVSNTARNITTGGNIYGNDIYAAAALVGGGSGIYIKAGAAAAFQVIAASGYFVGPGIDVTGPVHLRSGLYAYGNILTRATGIYVQNAAGSANLGYIDANGAVTTSGIRSSGDISCDTNIGATGAFYGGQVFIGGQLTLDSGGGFVGLGGVHVNADIVTQKNIGANGPTSGYYCAGGLVINSAMAFVGLGGVDTSNDVWARNLIARSGGGFIGYNNANTVQNIRLIGNTGLQMGNGNIVSWGNGAEYYSTADLAIGRASPGQLTVTNPSTGTAGNILAWEHQAQYRFVCQGQPGLGADGAPYPVDVTTPTGQKTIWIMGGIIYAVTG